MNPELELSLRPHRRFRRRIGFAAALLCVLALLVVLMVWSARPRWYTFVSRPTQSSPAFSLGIRVPVGWECRETNTLHSPPWEGIEVTVRRKPLDGLVRWWNEYVLRLDGRPQPPEGYTVWLSLYGTPGGPHLISLGSSHPDFGFTDGLPSEQRFFTHRGFQPTSRTFEHPLGPAHRFTLTFGGSGLAPRGYYERYESTWIKLRQHPEHEVLTVTALHIGSKAEWRRTQSTWEEIVRSIRIAQKLASGAAIEAPARTDPLGAGYGRYSGNEWGSVGDREP